MITQKKREEKKHSNTKESYKSGFKKTQSLRTEFFFIWGVSLTHPMLVSFYVRSLAHIPCWLLYVGNFSYTSGAGFFMWNFVLTCIMLGVYLTHPVLASLCGEFLLHISSCAGFFVWGISLTCTVLASSCGEFLLHIPCWPFMWGISFTFPC